MAASFIFFVAISSIAIQNAYCQCVNRVLPGCGPNLIEGLMPNQVLLREPGLPLIPTVPTAPIYPGPVIPAPIMQEAVGYAPTIIQDSSVANSLANALQLLVVSNLLSTTLPGNCDTYPVDFVGMPAAYNYNYVY